jgi:hypothetical protein
MAHAVRAERRVRRLERAALKLWLELIEPQERVYYQRLVRRVERDGLDSVAPEHQDRLFTLMSLVSGESVCR